MRYFASLKATVISSYTCFGYWEHFHVLEKLDLSLGRVFWGVMALKLGLSLQFGVLWHCDQSSLGNQLGAET